MYISTQKNINIECNKNLNKIYYIISLQIVTQYKKAVNSYLKYHFKHDFKYYFNQSRKQQEKESS